MSSPQVKHSSRINLSRSALKSNLRFIRERIGAHPVLSMVVKANAYGHGVEQIVPMAEHCGVQHFSVASSYEAQGVLECKQDDSTVMIMGILYDSDLPWAIENGVEFFVFDLPRLERAAEIAREVGRPAGIHLELETGGNRTGLDADALPAALKLLRKNSRQLRFRGLCTHLAGAESLANRFRITKQLKEFQRIRALVQKRKTVPELYHVASSAAALSLPDSTMDMVRVGTAAYGLWPSPDIMSLFLMGKGNSHKKTLQRIFTWKTDIMHLKKVASGEFVGYGTSFQAQRDMTVAVLPIGYGNGYPRELSNQGYVLIRGKRAPIIGAINMNMITVDVSHIKDAALRDEVVLVGRQKNNVISLRSFSEFSSALNNEFASRLPAAIPRRVVS